MTKPLKRSLVQWKQLSSADFQWTSYRDETTMQNSGDKIIKFKSKERK